MRSESPCRPGDLVDGKYRIQAVLGVGAMGVVVRAFHEQLERPVAIKFLLTDLLEDEGVVQRFEREARATARLKSEHIIEVLDVGRLPSGEPFIVMEFLEGSDLLKHLAGGRQLPLDEALDLIEQLCEGVGEAHAAGIVHRDLKPGNIYVTTRRDGRRLVKILDFGISKVAGDPSHELTGTKDLLGSPHYMSPEQLRASRDAGPACDVWALGIILYRLLTGVLPFDGETLASICVGVIQDDYMPIDQRRSDVPPWLIAIVDHCLQKDVPDRMPSVEAMGMALRGRGMSAAITISGLDHAATSFTPHSGVRTPSIPPRPSTNPGDTTRRREALTSPPGASRGTYVAAGLVALVVAIGGMVTVVHLATADVSTTPRPSGGLPPGSSSTTSAAQPAIDDPPDPRTAPSILIVAPPVTSPGAPPSATPPAHPHGVPTRHRKPPPGLPSARK